MKRERVSSPAAAGVVCFSLETATCHCASRGLRLSTVPMVHHGHSRPSPNTAQFGVSMHVFYSIKGIFFKSSTAYTRRCGIGSTQLCVSRAVWIFFQLQCCRWSILLSQATDRPQLSALKHKHQA